MVREQDLKRDALRVSNYINKYVRLAAPEKREELFMLFENMRQMFPQWGIMSCPMMHRDLHFATKNCQGFFGYSQDYLMEIRKPEKYFNHIHERDRNDLFQCFSFLNNFLEGISPDQHHLHRAIFNYRFKQGNGRYIHLHDEKGTLQLKDGENFYYGLFLDISDIIFAGVKIKIYRQGETLELLHEYGPSTSNNTLSKRERELVLLIKQGLRTKEIAGQLKISHHTVRNIKSKIFEKYNVTSSIELLNIAI